MTQRMDVPDPTPPPEASTPPASTTAPTEPATRDPLEIGRRLFYFLVFAFALGGIAAGVFFAIILANHDGDLTPTETISIFLMAPGLVFLGLGAAIHISEIFKPRERLGTNVDKPEGTKLKDLSEAITALLNALSGGKLFIAVGLLLMLSNAYVAKG